MEIRLHKFLAQAGIDSRRKCEQLIQQGLVKVDNETITELGHKIDPARHRVYYNGNLVQPEKRLYFIINKPKGYLCTNWDPSGRPKVIDLFKRLAQQTRLYTIGRLDSESEGLVLVTNDGALCQQLTHPRYRVPKTYWVMVRGRVEGPIIEKIQHGVWLAEGKSAPARIRVIKRSNEITILEIVLAEGKKREVRRLFARFHHPVKVLKRVKIGNLSLGNLKPGQFRPTSRAEILKPVTSY